MDQRIENLLIVLGVSEELDNFLKENPEFEIENPDFKQSMLDQIGLLIVQQFTLQELEKIVEFHMSDVGRKWLNKNEFLADNIEKLFQAHAAYRMSMRVFNELKILPFDEDKDPSFD